MIADWFSFYELKRMTSADGHAATFTLLADIFSPFSVILSGGLLPNPQVNQTFPPHSVTCVILVSFHCFALCFHLPSFHILS